MKNNLRGRIIAAVLASSMAVCPVAGTSVSAEEIQSSSAVSSDTANWWDTAAGEQQNSGGGILYETPSEENTNGSGAIVYDDGSSSEDSSQDASEVDQAADSSSSSSITEESSSESTSGENKKAEEKSEKETKASESRVIDDGTDPAASFHQVDFSSKRLLVASDDASIIRKEDKVLSDCDGIYLLQFDSEKDAEDAYDYYQPISIFTDADTPVVAAAISDQAYDDEGHVAVDAVNSEASGLSDVTEDDNPIGNLSDQTDTAEDLENQKIDIALIDSGAPEADYIKERISVIGDDPSDDNGHGTAMAGYIHSMNDKATVLSIKALDKNGDGSISSVYAAMEYAIRAGVKVINLSLSAYSTKDASAIRDAVEDAKKAGIVVIGAAGNNGKDAKYYVPGNIPDAVIAGAADFNGKRIQESNYGSTVDYYVEADSTSQAAARLAALWVYYDLPYDGDITESYKFPVIWKNDEVSEIGEIYKNADEELLDTSNKDIDDSKTAVVRYMYVKADQLRQNETITSIWNDNRKANIAEESISVPVYKNADGTYTIHADAPFKNGIVLESDYDKVDINVANGNNNGERITKGITIDKDHFAVIADESAMAMKEDDFANISIQVMVPLRSEGDNGSLTADDNDTDSATYGTAGWSLNDSAKSDADDQTEEDAEAVTGQKADSFDESVYGTQNQSTVEIQVANQRDDITLSAEKSYTEKHDALAYFETPMFDTEEQEAPKAKDLDVYLNDSDTPLPEDEYLVTDYGSLLLKYMAGEIYKVTVNIPVDGTVHAQGANANGSGSVAGAVGWLDGSKTSISEYPVGATQFITVNVKNDASAYINYGTGMLDHTVANHLGMVSLQGVGPVFNAKSPLGALYTGADLRKSIYSAPPTYGWIGAKCNHIYGAYNFVSGPVARRALLRVIARGTSGDHDYIVFGLETTEGICGTGTPGWVQTAGMTFQVFLKKQPPKDRYGHATMNKRAWTTIGQNDLGFFTGATHLGGTVRWAANIERVGRMTYYDTQPHYVYKQPLHGFSIARLSTSMKKLTGYDGNIEFAVQRDGIWSDWKTPGQWAEFNGAINSIRIRLTGDVAKHYSIWYGVHHPNQTVTGNADGGGTGVQGNIDSIDNIEIVYKGQAMYAANAGKSVDLRGTEYEIFTDPACTQRAKTRQGKPASFRYEDDKVHSGVYGVAKWPELKVDTNKGYTDYYFKEAGGESANGTITDKGRIRSTKIMFVVRVIADDYANKSDAAKYSGYMYYSKKPSGYATIYGNVGPNNTAWNMPSYCIDIYDKQKSAGGYPYDEILAGQLRIAKKNNMTSRKTGQEINGKNLTWATHYSYYDSASSSTKLISTLETKGWSQWPYGHTGEHVSALAVNFLNQTGYSGDIEYRVKQASLDGSKSTWSSWQSATNSRAALTEGSKQSDGSANWAGDSSRLTGGGKEKIQDQPAPVIAVQMRLTGELADYYTLVYSVHASGGDWSTADSSVDDSAGWEDKDVSTVEGLAKYAIDDITNIQLYHKLNGRAYRTVEGAEYSVIGYTDSGCTQPNGVNLVLTVDKGGVAWVKLPIGTYKVKEVKAPDGFESDEQEYTIAIPNPDDMADLAGDSRDTRELASKFGNIVVKTADTLITKLGIEIDKGSEIPTATDGNDMYDVPDASDPDNEAANHYMEGAVYEVYGPYSSSESITDASGLSSSKLVGTLTIGRNNKSDILYLEQEGKYFLKEVKAPSNGMFKLSTKITPVNVQESDLGITSVAVTDSPIFDPGQLIINKIDAYRKEGGTNKPVEGAVFRVEYYDMDYNKAADKKTIDDGNARPVKTWYFKTDSKGQLRLDKAYLDHGDSLWTITVNKKSQSFFPVGTYLVSEQSAPEGYLIDDHTYHAVVIPDASQENGARWTWLEEPADKQSDKTLVTGNVRTISDQSQPIMTSEALSETNKNSHIGKPSKDETIVEKLTITPNATGTFTLVSGLVDQKYGNYTDLLNPSGSIPGMDGKVIVQSVSLVQDQTQTITVTFHVNSSDFAKNGKQLVAVDYLYWDSEAKHLLGAHSDLNDTDQTISYQAAELPKGQVHTTAYDESTGSNVGNPLKDTATIIDTVHFEGFKEDSPIKATAWLVDENGSEIGGTRTTKTYAHAKDAGNMIHPEDLGDQPQFERKTTQTRTYHHYQHYWYGDCDEYSCWSHYDADSGQKPASGGNGKADEYYYGDGYFQMQITLPNPKNYVGKRVTVYEKVTAWVQDGGNTISDVGTYYTCSGGSKNDTTDNENHPGQGAKQQTFTHQFTSDKAAVQADATDVNGASKQTIFFPAMGTTVRDSNSTDHVGTVGKKASVIDTIGYQNLAVGQIYWFEGQLMKKDGTPYLDADGKPVKAVSERIVPEQTEDMKQKDIYYQNGQIEITFNFNATNLNGENLTNELRDLVVFEKMYTASLKNPKTEIGKHEDTKDESQTLHYPEIHTTLYLNNMKNGQEYDLKQTKLEKGITDISAKMSGRSYKQGNLVPYNNSTAKYVAGNPEERDTSKYIEFVDRVKYQNLIPGHTYILTGTLWAKETLRDADEVKTEDPNNPARPVLGNYMDFTREYTGSDMSVGGQYTDSEMSQSYGNVHGQVIFTPTAKDGTVDVPIIMDSNYAPGTLVVAFEDLKVYGISREVEDRYDTKTYPIDGSEENLHAFNKELKDGKVVPVEDTSVKDNQPFYNKDKRDENSLNTVATHSDINDKGQSIMTEFFTHLNTGGRGTAMFYITAAILAGAAVLLIVRKKRREKKAPGKIG